MGQVRLHYCTVCFELSLSDRSKLRYEQEVAGKFNALLLTSHSSIPLGQEHADDNAITFPVPINNAFYFVRCWSYSAGGGHVR